MASRRMFSRRVVGGARFLKMPPSVQALYFHLCLCADDDGVVEAYPVMRMIGATEDDVRILHAKQLVRVLNEDLVTHISDWLEHNKIRADRKVNSVYQKLLLEVVTDVEIVEPKPRSDVEDNTKRLNGQSTVSLGKDRIGKVRLEEKKTSFFRESDRARWEGVQTGTDYVSDGYPPHVKLAEKKKMEKALGLSPTPPKVKFMFFSGGKFLENYESLFGIPWEGKGILQLDPVAKTLSEWYDRGMREDGAAALVLQYFKSKKAREGTITPTACFSEHTWQAYRQNKLK